MADLTVGSGLVRSLGLEPGDRVLITSGFYAGKFGYFHELDETDPELPYGVEIGPLLVWVGPGQIEVAR